MGMEQDEPPLVAAHRSSIASWGGQLFSSDHQSSGAVSQHLPVDASEQQSYYRRLLDRQLAQASRSPVQGAAFWTWGRGEND